LGCLESYASGWGIAQRAKEIYAQSTADSPLRRLTQGQPELVTTQVVFEAYRQGDAQMQALIRSAMNSLSRAVADVVCMLDPDRVVVGGGIARSQDILLAEMVPYLEKYVPAFLRTHFDLRFSALDGNETLYGAALLTEGIYR
jgi:glucokinase